MMLDQSTGTVDPMALIQALSQDPQQPASIVNPSSPQQGGLGSLIAKIAPALGNKLSGLGSGIRNTINPIDPNSGIDPEFAKAQQRAAMLRMAAGIAGGRGLGQGLSQGLDAATNQYQSAMENAYNNQLKKKQMDQQGLAYQTQLAQQKQQHDEWVANHDIALQHLQLQKEDAAKGDIKLIEQPLPDGSGKVQRYMFDQKNPDKGLKPIGNPYTPANQAVNAGTVESTAQMIANGQIPMLNGMSLKTPWGQAVVERLNQIKPDYQAGDQPAIQRTITAFDTGKQGDAIRSLNVSIEHLDTLGQLGKALNNGDMTSFNKIGNIIASQTGKPAPKNFDAAKQIVAGEIIKAVTASGGGVTDRQEAQKDIDMASSPEQLSGVIDTYQALLAGQLGGLKRQYETSTGRADFEKKLSPKVREKLGSLVEQQNSAPPATSGGWSITPVQ